MNTSHICLQGVLEAKPLVTVVAGEGGARPEGCVSQGLSAAQWPVPTYREAGMGPKLLEKKPWKLGPGGSISSALLAYCTGTFTLEGSSSQAWGARTGAWYRPGPILGYSWHTPVKFRTTPSLPPPWVPARVVLSPFGCHVGFYPALSLKTAHSPWHQWTLPWWESVPQSKNGWCRHLAQVEICPRVVVGNQPESWSTSNCFLCFVWKVNKFACPLQDFLVA